MKVLFSIRAEFNNAANNCTIDRHILKTREKRNSHLIYCQNLFLE